MSPRAKDSEEERTANQPAISTLTDERIRGALDAAIVFAAAAIDAYQNGETEIGDACFSDATDLYENVMDALPMAGLPEAQLRNLQDKFTRLRELLGHLQPR